MRVIDVYIDDQVLPRDQWSWDDGRLTIQAEACGNFGRYTLRPVFEELPINTSSQTWIVPVARPSDG